MSETGSGHIARIDELSPEARHALALNVLAGSIRLRSSSSCWQTLTLTGSALTRRLPPRWSWPVAADRFVPAARAPAPPLPGR